jgi:predicted RNA-binding protein Jag
VHSETRDEAIRKVKPELILDVIDYGEKREDIFQEWFETWTDKVKNHRETIQHEIRQIKSPSKKVKK